jgi:hypothetical protein
MDWISRNYLFHNKMRRYINVNCNGINYECVFVDDLSKDEKIIALNFKKKKLLFKAWNGFKYLYLIKRNVL